VSSSQFTGELAAKVAEVRAKNDHILRRQLLGNDADYALARLRDAYANDLIDAATLESVTEDIVFGRPTRMPPLPPRDPGKPSRY
jgi:hypothetical protein